MLVRDIMTKDPAMCRPNTTLDDVAQLMVDNDCGAIPVVEDYDTKRLIGIVTDRDIVCRVVARRINPLDATADDCMSRAVASVSPQDEIDECWRLMERGQVRRIPVVQDGACVGIVTQAKLAKALSDWKMGEVVRAVSEKSHAASRLDDGQA